MYTERQAIHDEMNFNRKMIQDYREHNVELLKRLRELDERDTLPEVEVKEEEKPKEELKKKQPRMSSTNSSAIVLEIMKDFKMAKTKEIEEEFYNRSGRRFDNFYNVMNAALKYCPDELEKRKGGLYVYTGE